MVGRRQYPAYLINKTTKVAQKTNNHKKEPPTIQQLFIEVNVTYSHILTRHHGLPQL